MKTIAFDIMGNENGLKVAIDAALDFCEKRLDYSIVLVGDREQIIKYTKETAKIKILDVPRVCSYDMNVLEARRIETSMSVAIKLVKENKADAVVSSGSSKHYIALCTLILGRIPGIDRPAFMSIIPTIIPGQKFLLLDIGANIEVKGDTLVQWAKLGSAFSEKVLNVINPRVALNNIGTEKDKGFDYHQDADKILSRQKKINYIGFLEPKSLLYGDCDVLVSDGYAGNIVLKTLEGGILAMLKLIKKTVTKNVKRKIGSLMLKNAFSEVKESLDYRNVGAAWVIGANGLAIKSHGSSDCKAYSGALNQVYIAIEAQAFQKIKDALK